MCSEEEIVDAALSVLTTADAAQAMQLDAPVFFVGDLDPTDLLTYATLVSGNSAGSRLSGTSYLGVGDEWLALCEADRAKLSLSDCTIALDAGERRALDRI